MRAITIMLLLVLVGLGPGPVDANNPIQPGDLINGQCTLAFILDGQGPLAGNVYALSASHCFGRVGRTVSTSGHTNFGTVVYKGNDANTPTDFALIEIKADVHDHVDASVRGHPNYPTGYTTAQETEVGDLLQFSGYGNAFSFTGPTREERVGALTRDNARVVYFAGPMDFGDSGGPIIHIPTGKAIGLESRIGFPFGSDVGPTVEGILAKLDAAGYSVVLRTV